MGKKDIMIHCSATPIDQDLTPQRLAEMHQKRGIRYPGGYHIYITKDGQKHHLRPFEMNGAHCYGRNTDSLGICYEGGIKAGGDPYKASDAIDTRTKEQKKALSEAIIECIQWNKNNGVWMHDIEILGHRDVSPDIDGDGIIEPWEYIKQCPCFDVKSEYSTFVKYICTII